jgi:hypothetical protein
MKRIIMLFTVVAFVLVMLAMSVLPALAAAPPGTPPGLPAGPGLGPAPAAGGFPPPAAVGGGFGTPECGGVVFEGVGAPPRVDPCGPFD